MLHQTPLSMNSKVLAHAAPSRYKMLDQRMIRLEASSSFYGHGCNATGLALTMFHPFLLLRSLPSLRPLPSCNIDFAVRRATLYASMLPGEYRLVLNHGAPTSSSSSSSPDSLHHVCPLSLPLELHGLSYLASNRWRSSLQHLLLLSL